MGSVWKGMIPEMVEMVRARTRKLRRWSSRLIFEVISQNFSRILPAHLLISRRTYR